MGPGLMLPHSHPISPLKVLEQPHQLPSLISTSLSQRHGASELPLSILEVWQSEVLRYFSLVHRLSYTHNCKSQSVDKPEEVLRLQPRVASVMAKV